jgi:SAM-dependent methyltransferase
MDISTLYSTDDYWSLNPSFHSDESHYKYKKLIPYIEVLIAMHHSKSIRILDIGGGAGYICLFLCTHLCSRGIIPEVTALDLSPLALEKQKEINPFVTHIIQGDVTSVFESNTFNFDVTLMIDVVEHTSDPHVFLRRISLNSRYILFNIPIEINIFDSLRNLYFGGTYYDRQTYELGHLHFYSCRTALALLSVSWSLLKPFAFAAYSELLTCVSTSDSKLQFSNKLRSLEISISQVLNLILPPILKSRIIQGSIYGIAASKKLFVLEQ